VPAAVALRTARMLAGLSATAMCASNLGTTTETGTNLPLSAG
jgi:hypothetical protein